MTWSRLEAVMLAGLLGVLAGSAAWAQGAGPPRRGMRPWRRRADTSFFTSVPKPKDDAEKKILDVLDHLFRTQRRGMQNVPMDDGRLLRVLAETSGAKHVVEIGTSNGYSALWFCLALRTTGGRLTTCEIDPRRAAMARENFKRAGVDAIVTLIEGNAHDTVAQIKGPIDIVFLDADKQGYLDYLRKLLPLVRPGGLVVAHNINPGQADPRYVKAITSDPALETILVNLHTTGVGVTLKKR